MQITVLTESPSGKHVLPGLQSPSFYIQTGSYHCLFVSDTLNRLRENASACGINLEKTDRIVITERCPGLIQELQHFLVYNPSVTFYLPRQTYQNYFSGLLYKLKEYSKNDRYPDWLSHIRFTDTLNRIDEQTWLYSFPDKNSSALPPKQVLTIREGSLSYLFVNADSTDAEINVICKKIYEMTQYPVGSIFYRDTHRQCIRRNCTCSETAAVISGKTMIL